MSYLQGRRSLLVASTCVSRLRDTATLVSLYYTQLGAQIVVLLAGGSKRSQKKDIQRAKALAAMLKSERDKDERDH